MAQKYSMKIFPLAASSRDELGITQHYPGPPGLFEYYALRDLLDGPMSPFSRSGNAIQQSQRHNPCNGWKIPIPRPQRWDARAVLQRLSGFLRQVPHSNHIYRRTEPSGSLKDHVHSFKRNPHTTAVQRRSFPKREESSGAAAVKRGLHMTNMACK